MSANAARYLETPGTHAAVAAVWSFASQEASSSLVAADGCFDVILRTSELGRVSAFVYAPGTRAQHVPIDAGTRLLGVRLRPGYGAALGDRRRLEILRDVERHTNEQPCKLESLVTSAIDAYGTRPDIVADFVANARATAGAFRLTTQSSSARASTARERELQRACRRWLRMTPKAFLRIERAWAARDEIRKGTTLGALAINLGYADQAHLTREVRELLGVTPGQLRPVGILQDESRLAR